MFSVIRNFTPISKFLITILSKALTVSLILPRLDCCTRLLVGSAKFQIVRLQRIENIAAWIVSLAKRLIAWPSPWRLHWLPLDYRIQFKVMCITCKCIAGNASKYLCHLLSSYNPIRTHRSQERTFVWFQRKTMSDTVSALSHTRLLSNQTENTTLQTSLQLLIFS